MSFPTTPVLDTFVRPAENPLSDSGNWGGQATASQSVMQTNGTQALATASGSNGQVWNPLSLTDSEVYMTLAVLPGNNQLATLYARIVNEGSGTTSGYNLTLSQLSGTDDVLIRRITSGGTGTLAVISQDFNAGDKIGLSVIGSSPVVLTAYRFDVSSGLWGAIGSYSDSSGQHAGPGKIGFGCSQTTARLTAFGGSAPTTTQIKTVEGLAKASVKTFEGLAIASVKTIEGLA